MRIHRVRVTTGVKSSPKADDLDMSSGSRSREFLSMANSSSCRSIGMLSGNRVSRTIWCVAFLSMLFGICGQSHGQEATPKLPLPLLKRMPGDVQVRLQMGANGRNTSIQVTNGRRVMKVTDGADTIEIRDTDGRDIEIEHRRVVMGKPTVDKYKATDLETLRKNSPAGAKLYDTYSKEPAAIQIQVLGEDRAIPLFGRPGTSLTRRILVEQPDQRIEFAVKPDGSVHVKIVRFGEDEALLDKTFANFAELGAADSRLVNWYRQYVGTPTPE